MQLKIQILSNIRLLNIFIKLVKSSDFRMRVPSEKIWRTISALDSALSHVTHRTSGFFPRTAGFSRRATTRSTLKFHPQ